MYRGIPSAFPDVPGIDLNFRPASYFWPLDLATHLLSRVKGAERKAALQRLIEGGDLGRVPELLVSSGLLDADRRAIGRLHPAFMGGEYLPDMAEREVEIVRITIASVTQDVTSVYAKRGKNRIYYRVVDEYDGDTLSEKRTRVSTRPLSLGELEVFFSGAWSIFDVLAMNFGVDGYDMAQMQAFVCSVESQFYPQIEMLYRARIGAWGEEQRARNQAST